MKTSLASLSLVVSLAMSSHGQGDAGFSGSIERLDPSLDRLIAPGAKVELLSTGFNWSEGPVWFEGGIVFSDVPENTAYIWKEGMSKAEVFLKPSGATKIEGGQGSNGLARDADGSLILCQHGDRRLAKLGPDRKFATVVGRDGDHRFNSPNDLAIAKNGDIFFTDPPYGLKGGNQSAEKELSVNGVYRLAKDSGKLSLIIADLTFPNGIALSPDERVLYVAVSDPVATRVMAYDLQPDGTVKNGRVFFNAQPLKSKERKGGCDGLKTDTQGHVWTTGPGGVLILSPAGKHLGTILTGQATANCGWGDDGASLYITADMHLLRIKTLARGW